MKNKGISANYIVLYPIISDDQMVNGLSCFSYMQKKNNDNSERKPNFIINCIKKVTIITIEDIDKNEIKLQLTWLPEIASLEFKEEIIRKKEKRVEINFSWLLDVKKFDTAIIKGSDDLSLTKTSMISSKFVIDWKDKEKLEIKPKNKDRSDIIFQIKSSKKELKISII